MQTVLRRLLFGEHALVQITGQNGRAHGERADVIVRPTAGGGHLLERGVELGGFTESVHGHPVDEGDGGGDGEI